ncbi:MAG TPA: EfeM/EfeO family lipoprotein [Solirubrobacterales bacterium]|nr:EfeM/EfeO family lipoprotein [Solirubrobacterales bacterium]
MERLPFHLALVATVTSLLLALFATGCGSGGDPPKPAKIDQYRAWLEESSENLTTMTGRLLAKIEAGELLKAESRYASARVFYGQVQPAAALFDDLDTRIDARANDVPANEFGGFHRIEKAFVVEGTTDGMAPVAKQLLADVEELQHEIETAPIKADQLADSADALLNEVSTSTIKGGEELYMHIDLVDVAARIEGVEAAFKALKPPLLSEDPELVKEIEASFAKVYATLSPWGPAAREPDQPRAQEPGIAFVIYSELSGESVEELAKPIDALAELFSQVPEQISQE